VARAVVFKVAGLRCRGSGTAPIILAWFCLVQHITLCAFTGEWFGESWDVQAEPSTAHALLYLLVRHLLNGHLVKRGQLGGSTDAPVRCDRVHSTY
jgi:hypothetical protein